MKTFRRILIAGFLVVLVLNWTWGRLPKEPPPPVGSHFATVDDVKFHYVETPGRDPAVVMIHGHPGTFLDWAYVQNKLPGRHTISIDRPGYGYSSGGYISFDDQVKAIHDLTVRLGLRKPVIAGHSYGGAIALAYGLRYPKETKAIVPVDPAVQTDYPQAFDLVQAHFVKVLQLPIVRPVVNATFGQAMLTATSGPQVKEAFDPNKSNPDYSEQLKAVNLKSSDLKTFADETLNADDLDTFRTKFRLMKTPAWVVQGKQDKLVPATSVTAMVHQLPNAHYMLLTGGHMQTWVHPADVASAIKSASR